MARWLVTQGDRQFSASDLNELKQFAADGRLGAGDMVQPPGASDWLYASELPELANLFQAGTSQGGDDFEIRRRGIPMGLLVSIFFVIVALGGYGMYHFAMGIKDRDLDLLGKDGIKYTEMLVTADPANLKSEPSEGASTVGSVPKDTQVKMYAKRGQWYQIESETGTKGWIDVRSVTPPGYVFAGKEVHEEYDPLYNPDRYVFVSGSSWMQLPDQKSDNVTIFQFQLKNISKYEMREIILLATIRDENDAVLETKEIVLEGTLEPYSAGMVGTLQAGDDEPDGAPRAMTEMLFKKLADDTPELHMRWSFGVEVQMESEGFKEANIDLLQVVAVRKDG